MSRIIPFEKVAIGTPGTPVQLTTESHVNAWAVIASADNTGIIYLGLQGMSYADFIAGTPGNLVFWELRPGQVFNSTTGGLNDLDPSKVYIDGPDGGDYLTGPGLER